MSKANETISSLADAHPERFPWLAFLLRSVVLVRGQSLKVPEIRPSASMVRAHPAHGPP